MIIYNRNFNKFISIFLYIINSKCIKFDEVKQNKSNRVVELRPIADENANEILEKNLRERKEEMEKLNLSVTDITQELFDYLYRTLPNKCKWDRKNNLHSITFPNMKLILKQPYQKLTLNGMNKKNKSVQYIETQLNSFWQKYNKKTNKNNSNTPTKNNAPIKSPPPINNNNQNQNQTHKKKKKKKKTKSPKHQNKKNKNKNQQNQNNNQSNNQNNNQNNNMLQQQQQQFGAPILNGATNIGSVGGAGLTQLSV